MCVTSLMRFMFYSKRLRMTIGDTATCFKMVTQHGIDVQQQLIVIPARNRVREQDIETESNASCFENLCLSVSFFGFK